MAPAGGTTKTAADTKVVVMRRIQSSEATCSVPIHAQAPAVRSGDGSGAAGAFESQLEAPVRPAGAERSGDQLFLNFVNPSLRSRTMRGCTVSFPDEHAFLARTRSVQPLKQA
jgi:hypothetical protein